MKKLLIIALSAFLGAACTSRPSAGTTLDIEVTNPTLSNVGLLVDRSTAYTAELDKHGRATITLPEGVEYLYGRLVYGEQLRPIFLQRGDGATVRFDGLHFAESLEVEGANRAANDYLRTTTLPEAPSYEVSWDDFTRGSGSAPTESSACSKPGISIRCVRISHASNACACAMPMHSRCWSTKWDIR